MLWTLAAFRMPATWDTLCALLIGKGKNKACRDQRALAALLAELEDRGLVGWDRAANRYDLHPIVRGVVWSVKQKDPGAGNLKAIEEVLPGPAVPGPTEAAPPPSSATAQSHTHTIPPADVKPKPESRQQFAQRYGAPSYLRKDSGSSGWGGSGSSSGGSGRGFKAQDLWESNRRNGM